MIRRVVFSGIAFLITAASGLAILYGFELAFNPYRRLPVNGWIGGELHTWGHRVENNRYGFRERNFVSQKPPGTYRVMVLGDSFTWGIGLAADERYTAVAERYLNATRSGWKFEVLNFGIPGYSTTRERNVLREYRDVVDPDLIVIGFCFNDPQPNLFVEREQLRVSEAGRHVARVQEYLRKARLGYLAELVGTAFFSAAATAGMIDTWQEELQRAYVISSEEWQDFVQALRDIRRMSDALGLPRPIFAVLNHGRYSSDYENPDGYLKQYQTWNHQAERAAQIFTGLTTYNHEHEIPRQIHNEFIQVNRLDDHPAANLNRVYGRKLYLEILKVIETQQLPGRREGN